MATEDLGPLNPELDAYEIASLSASMSLGEFLSEGDNAKVSPRSEPIVERALKTAPESPGAADAPVVTLFDLLDHRDAMDWRETVAVVRALCVELKDCWPERPVVLDPRNILITASGEVRVIPGLPGGDPLVIQIGRLLRTLLLNKPVPPEVRLILSQATFELPIFDSIEDVARALGQVSTLQQIDGVRFAYARAVEPGPTHAVGTVKMSPPPAQRPILPTPQRSNRFLLTGFLDRKDDLLLIATAIVGTAACAAMIVAQSTSQNRPARVQTPLQLRGSTVDAPAIPGTVASADSGSGSPDTREVVAPPLRRRSEPTRVTGRASQLGMTLSAVSAYEPEITLSMPRAAPPEAAPASPREAELRAIALMKAGKSAEAEIAFDALVLNNPLYEPTRTEMTPEAHAAFQASRRVLLPGIAIRDLGRARAALAQGNVDRAVAIATEVDAVLDRVEPDGPPELRRQVRALLDGVLEARAAEDELVYTGADAGIVAPRPLSRQFPLAPPGGIRPDRIGVLEIVVGKEGDVEFVKLHTTLNRYHERMVVSAAKAWLYRPARKDGKPVRYRLNVRINLPESGAENWGAP